MLNFILASFRLGCAAEKSLSLKVKCRKFAEVAE
jgi:hypothetical protein